MASPHTLSFHLVRLSRPGLDLDPPLRFDAYAFSPDASGDGGASAPPSALPPHGALTDPLAAFEAAPGAVAPPPAFGSVWLGEPFSTALALAASPAGAGVADASYRAELATPDGRREVLADGHVDAVAPGSRASAAVRCDVRCVGRHALALTAAYTDVASGERKHLSSHFAFAAAAPLAVRTKVRGDPTAPRGRAALVEATVESMRKASPLALTAATFEASSTGVSVTRVGGGESGGPPAPPLPPGGAASFLFRVVAALDTTLPPDLGRLDLRWATPFGGGGRLQTQAVAAPPPPPGADASAPLRARASLSSAPRPAPLGAPFTVTITTTVVEDAVGGPFGPLRLDAPPPADGGSVVVVGPRGARVAPALAPGASASTDVTLIALAPGVHRVPPLGLVDEGEGRVLDVVTASVVVADK